MRVGGRVHVRWGGRVHVMRVGGEGTCYEGRGVPCRSSDKRVSSSSSSSSSMDCCCKWVRRGGERGCVRGEGGG